LRLSSQHRAVITYKVEYPDSVIICIYLYYLTVREVFDSGAKINLTVY
jgi:hypothetical protein